VKNRFYGVFNETQEDSEQVGSFEEAREWLTTHLKMGDVGTIYTCEYLDDNGYEYEVLQTKNYKNILGKLTFVGKEKLWKTSKK